MPSLDINSRCPYRNPNVSFAALRFGAWWRLFIWGQITCSEVVGTVSILNTSEHPMGERKFLIAQLAHQNVPSQERNLQAYVFACNSYWLLAVLVLLSPVKSPGSQVSGVHYCQSIQRQELTVVVMI